MNVLQLVKTKKMQQLRRDNAVAANTGRKWATYRGVGYEKPDLSAEYCPECGHKIEIKPKNEYKYRGQSYIA
jgi:rRNA maturation endonuclease Nob1